MSFQEKGALQISRERRVRAVSGKDREGVPGRESNLTRAWDAGSTQPLQGTANWAGWRVKRRDQRQCPRPWGWGGHWGATEGAGERKMA